MADPNTELQAWLEKHHARTVAQGDVGNQHHDVYLVNGHLLIVARYPNNQGWEIYIPADDRTTSIESALKAAERACGLQSL